MIAEFLPEYLTAVWDTALLPLFDTFIFDSKYSVYTFLLVNY